MRFSIPILQRFILRDLLLVFFFLLSGVTILLVFVGVFRQVSASGLGPVQALKILPYIVPSLLPFTIPATFLLTVCVVYGRMAGDREIIAAKAAGINVFSLLLPAISLGGVLSLCSLLLADRVVPWAVHNIQATVSQAMEEIFLDMLRANGQVVDNDRGFSITVMDVQGKRLIQPTFHYQPKGRKPVAVQAQEATLRFDMENRQVVLDMVRGQIDIPGQRKVWFEKQEQPFPLPFDAQQTKPRHLSVRNIRRELDRINGELEEARTIRDAKTAMILTVGDFDDLKRNEMFAFWQQTKIQRDIIAKLRTEVHSRFVLSTSCFFFALVGAPFAVLQAKRQFLATFFICFLPMLLAYYPLALLTMNLSKSETVHPAVTWAANVAMLIAGLVILRRVLRH
ncbi:MAG: LptF/LptG family permease [Planctomycetaceae bacterium]